MADCSFILFNKSFLQLRLVGARGGRAFARKPARPPRPSANLANDCSAACGFPADYR
jgi:hypothetical protein